VPRIGSRQLGHSTAFFPRCKHGPISSLLDFTVRLTSAIIAAAGHDTAGRIVDVLMPHRIDFAAHALLWLHPEGDEAVSWADGAFLFQIPPSNTLTCSILVGSRSPKRIGKLGHRVATSSAQP
jgi:hypothetical protein